VSPAATSGEIQTVVAARALAGARSCFIGVGRPSTAAILARAVVNPDLVLVYESGTIGAKPKRIPLSIGDGELAATADAVVGVVEMFNYWIQPGRIDVAFLGAAQVDRRGGLNSTVIGDYDAPRTRLPGAGGAPEIAAAAKRVIVIVRQSPRTFVERVDFLSSVGYGPTGTERDATGAGPTLVITDHGVLEPDPDTHELTLTRLHEGVTVDAARAATGWSLKVAGSIQLVPPPSATELSELRRLRNREEAIDA